MAKQGVKKITPEVRDMARIFWLSGQFSSDEDIAAEILKQTGVEVAFSSIAGWRKQQDWLSDMQKLRDRQLDALTEKKNKVIQEWVGPFEAIARGIQSDMAHWLSQRNQQNQRIHQTPQDLRRLANTLKDLVDVVWKLHALDRLEVEVEGPVRVEYQSIGDMANEIIERLNGVTETPEEVADTITSKAE